MASEAAYGQDGCHLGLLTEIFGIVMRHPSLNDSNKIGAVRREQTTCRVAVTTACGLKEPGPLGSVVSALE